MKKNDNPRNMNIHNPQEISIGHTELRSEIETEYYDNGDGTLTYSIRWKTKPREWRFSEEAVAELIRRLALDCEYNPRWKGVFLTEADIMREKGAHNE